MRDKPTFKHGDAVLGKKWSGAPIIGLYEYTNADGSHIVLDIEEGRRFNIKVGDLYLATETQASIILKAFKQKNLTLHEKSTSPIPRKKTKMEEEFEIALA